MDSFDGYGNACLRDLNGNEINWRGGKWSRSPCQVCSNLFADGPGEGSYASTLQHYERLLRPVPWQKSDIRCFVVFARPREIPREKVKPFTAAEPLTDPKKLGPQTHRYFCLSPVAWNNLGLHKLTGSREPCWPNDKTASAYLRRYFKPGTWSYDAIIAYFLSLFRVNDAYITNLAKCSFSSERQKVYNNCIETHLLRELRAFDPNVVLSFTSQLSYQTRARLNRIGLGTPEKALLSLRHPAARGKPQDKINILVEQVRGNREHLESLGCKVDEIITQWTLNANAIPND